MSDSGLLTASELRRPSRRFTLAAVHLLVLLGVGIAGVGPLLWLVAASLNTTGQVLSDPIGVFGRMTQWTNYADAFRNVDTARLLLNTVAVAAGSALVTVVVALTAGYVIAILRPRWAPILTGAVLATIFLPAVVSLVPLYLTTINLFGTGISLQNTFWSVWLPAGANAFAVLLVTGYLRSLPRELIEAAAIDGAGPIRTLWSIVLPLTRPILGVVTLLAAIGAWKDYLWPSLVLTNPDLRPISVALPIIERSTDLATFFSVLVVASLVPIALFMIFQRPLLASAGATAGLKD